MISTFFAFIMGFLEGKQENGEFSSFITDAHTKHISQITTIYMYSI